MARSEPRRWRRRTGTRGIKPEGSTVPVPFIKLFSNTGASRIIVFALTTPLTVIQSSLAMLGPIMFQQMLTVRELEDYGGPWVQ